MDIILSGGETANFLFSRDFPEPQSKDLLLPQEKLNRWQDGFDPKSQSVLFVGAGDWLPGQ